VSKADVFEVVELGAAKVVTIKQDNGIWRTAADRVAFGKGFAGTFVRVDPPAKATEERVRMVEAGLRAVGAVAVKVLRKREGATVTAPKAAEPGRTARQVVMGMVDESRSRDHDALREACDRALSGEGL
jgi:hypothetical protein